MSETDGTKVQQKCLLSKLKRIQFRRNIDWKQELESIFTENENHATYLEQYKLLFEARQKNAEHTNAMMTWVIGIVSLLFVAMYTMWKEHTLATIFCVVGAGVSIYGLFIVGIFWYEDQKNQKILEMIELKLPINATPQWNGFGNVKALIQAIIFLLLFLLFGFGIFQ